MSEPVYTTGEVAKLVGVNFRTVIRWIERGELEGYKLPGRGDHRITKSSLVAFIEKYRMPMPIELVTQKPYALIVDDDPSMAYAIARVLKHRNWETRIAQNGFEAGVEVGLYKPSVMILDLMMPYMDGFKVLKFTREKLGMKGLRIIVVSGQDDATLKEASEQGADAVLAKPFRNEELIEIIETWFPNE